MGKSAHALLEDIDNDSLNEGPTQVVVNSGGGGSMGWLLLLGLGIVAWMWFPALASHRHEDRP